MQKEVRYLIAIGIVIAELIFVDLESLQPILGGLNGILTLSILVFLDGVFFPLILDSLIPSILFSLSIVSLFTMIDGPADPLIFLEYLSGIGITTAFLYLTRSLWDTTLMSLRRMRRRPDTKIFIFSVLLGIAVFALTRSPFLIIGVIIDGVVLSFLGRTELSLLSSLSWISLPYLLMMEPREEVNGICIGEVEKVLVRSLTPGLFQAGYRYKWISKRKSFCIDFSRTKNYNIVIVGSSGYGKSTLAKLILSKTDVDYVIFDIHDEYRDVPGKNVDMSLNGINPLSLFGRSPKQRSIEIAMTLKSIFNLGSIQTMDLSNLFVEAYQEKGIYDEDERTWTLDPPTIRDVLLLLEKKKRASMSSQDLNRWGSIEPYLRFLDSNIFYGSEDLWKLLQGRVILDFSRITTANIKYILMETVLASILGSMYLEKSSSLRKLVVIDEAPFLLGRESGEALTERLFAEGRKFGYGFVLISQYSDKLEKMINNASTTMVMGMNDPDELNYIARLIGGESQEARRIIYETLSGLERGKVITRDITANDIVVVRLNQG
ncbi:DNA double-strand break repair helicase HerA [Metallosphaera sp. J1]|uniref:ATP-binding protein n=1 Tax=Metallosphaera javensis (ex Hofmann et al. 2022) TaxID=99938 RepID=UPI001EE060CB|nr:DUF87 domain-containing protein [Metallosphaera javensis (ex Hofmann et al. 2022)]MCG3107816.1 DNA double-strand break repair helicase HerA [Metallosphaera javensis (ex Hofmann et al. 2022)]